MAQVLQGARNPAACGRICAATYECVRQLTTQKPLRLFICAPEGHTDQAVASLVTSLKHLHPGPVQVDGVAGPLSEAAGLNLAIEPSSYPQLTLAEQLKSLSWVPGKKHAPEGGVTTPTVAFQARQLQRLVLQVFRGGSSRATPDNSPAQQQCQHTSAAGSRPHPAASSSSVSTQAKLQEVHKEKQQYDAVIPVGGAVFNRQLLSQLQLKSKQYNHHVPPMIPYMVPGLNEPQQIRRILTHWPITADHILCVSPHEPPLFKFSDCPTSFVGHPAVQWLMEQQEKQREQRKLPRAGQSTAGAGWFDSQPAAWQWEGRFGAGDASRFQRQHGSRLWGVAKHTASAAAGSSSNGTSSSNSSGKSGRGSRSRSSSTTTSGSTPVDSSMGVVTGGGQPLVALLPGRLERDMVSLMEPMDLITRRLAAVQPSLAAVMIVPPLWVPAATAATANFKVPVVVVSGADQAGVRDALAAATIAISNAGEVSLHCVAAGLPMVCLRKLHPLRDGLNYQLTKKLLPATALPNLVAAAPAAAHSSSSSSSTGSPGASTTASDSKQGSQVTGQHAAAGSSSSETAVPEVILWRSASVHEAAQAAELLLSDSGARAAQVAYLRRVVRALLPAQQQPLAAAAAAAPAAGGSRQMTAPTTPSDAAARVLLQLLRPPATDGASGEKHVV